MEFDAALEFSSSSTSSAAWPANVPLLNTKLDPFQPRHAVHVTSQDAGTTFVTPVVQLPSALQALYTFRECPFVARFKLTRSASSAPLAKRVSLRAHMPPGSSPLEE